MVSHGVSQQQLQQMYVINLILIYLISLAKGPRNKTLVSLVLILLLGLFAGTRNSGIDNDYLEYQRLFVASVTEGYQLGYEPIFYLLPNFLVFFSSIAYVNATFLAIALIGVGTKLWAIKNSSINYAMSVLIYFCIFFIGQEMTTIRAGVAAGIFLLAIPDLLNNNNKVFFFKFFISFLFHYSSILFLPIWFIVKREIGIKYYVFALIASFLVFLLKFNLLAVLNLDFFPKMEVYLNGEDEVAINPFNFKILISLLFLGLFWLGHRKLKDNAMYLLLLKIHLISLILFYLLAPAGMAFALRSFELLSIVQILLFPYLFISFSKHFRPVAYIVLVSASLINLYYVLIVSGNIKDYSSWLF